jgi:hypothetical protein
LTQDGATSAGAATIAACLSPEQAAELVTELGGVMAVPFKPFWKAGDADTVTYTISADEAGTYTTYTSDGGSGTITYNLNGAGFSALSGTIVLALSDTLIVRRTTTTNQGYSRWMP